MMIFLRFSIIILNILYFITSVRSLGENVVKSKYINKCCEDGEILINQMCLKLKHNKKQKLDFSEVQLYDNKKKLTGKKLTDVYKFHYGIMKNATFNASCYEYASTVGGHNNYLSEIGVLYDEEPNEWIWWREISNDKFCIDYTFRNEKFVASFCYILPIYINEQTLENTIFVAGFFVSSFFLFLVLLVKCLLPGKRNLSNMVQTAYVISILGAFLLLGTMKAQQYSRQICLGLTYCTYFFVLASFSWMSVMSYDLWCVHGKNHYVVRTSETKKANSRFIQYNGFAWGVPIAMTSFLAITNHVDMRHIPWFMTPNINKWSCFLDGERIVMYLYVPMLIMILSNWVFFLLISFSIWKRYKDSSAVDSNGSTRNSHRTLKTRFLMYLKLSIITGLSWVLEVVSYFSPTFGLWKVTDFYNMLVGVLIFAIFICNKKTCKKLKLRFKRNKRINVVNDSSIDI